METNNFGQIVDHRIFLLGCLRDMGYGYQVDWFIKPENLPDEKPLVEYVHKVASSLNDEDVLERLEMCGLIYN